MALKVSTYWTVAALLVRDAVGLGSRGGGRRRGVDRQARLGEWYRLDQALVNSDPMEDSGLRHGP